MTYYGASDLAASFRQVRANTIQIAEDIPEHKYDFKAAPDCRSVAQTLVHIALAIPSLHMHLGQNKVTDLGTFNFMEFFQNVGAEEAKPRTKAEIIALLKSEGEKFANYLAGANDAFLAEPVTMPQGAQPPTKTRFEMVMSAKEHEMHHRAQLMQVQRMLGIVPHITRQMQERMAQRAQAART
jgi:uncharacterized damage-inducible protein DinB